MRLALEVLETGHDRAGGNGNIERSADNRASCGRLPGGAPGSKPGNQSLPVDTCPYEASDAPILSIPLFCLPQSWNAGVDIRWLSVAEETTARLNADPISITESTVDSGSTARSGAAKRGAADAKHASEMNLFAQTERRQSADASRSENHDHREQSIGYVLPWVAYCWMAGSLLWFGTVIYRGSRFGRLLRRARRAPEQIQFATQQLAAQLSIRRAPHVLVVDANVSPFLWEWEIAL